MKEIKSRIPETFHKLPQTASTSMKTKLWSKNISYIRVDLPTDEVPCRSLKQKGVNKYEGISTFRVCLQVFLMVIIFKTYILKSFLTPKS